MATKPTYASVELNGQDGPIQHENVRVIFADRLAFEKTAKARHWNPETMPFTTAGFLAWAALQRRGEFTGTFDEFLGQVVDVELDDAKAAEGDDADPTQQGR